jgi:GPH family glycoside/pentoside/hexuronide:cation symporter
MTVATDKRLWVWGMFGGLIAMAGLPIYIHAPKFFVDQYGVSLAALGLVLAALRLVDVVQDPLLGWLAGITRARRGLWVAGAAVAMALGMVGLFALPAPMAPLAWFALAMLVVFSAWSFLSICFYAQGVTRAEAMGPQGHIRLAGWREGGALVGVCLAAVAPVALASVTDSPLAMFALIFAGLTLVTVALMAPEWRTVGATTPAGWAAFRPVLADPLARRLLWIALLNSAPVAVTSTLFLFFVESRLQAPGDEGWLLLLFFLSAAISTPFWSRAAASYGARNVLLAAMGLAIATFLWAATLGAGALLPFALICIASGAALGADNTLLPAIFARRLSHLAGTEAAAFGLWAFVSKLSLALAAAVLLPLLGMAGFIPGPTNTAAALAMLSLLYAIIPCILKVFALGLLFFTDVPEV